MIGGELALIGLALSLTAAPSLHVVVGVLPSVGFTVSVNRAELPDSPYVADDLGILAFQFEAACPCTVTIVVQIDGPPSITCKESER